MDPFETALLELSGRLRARNENESWQQIQGDFPKVSKALLWKIAVKGYRPKQEKTLLALGLPVPARVVSVNGHTIENGALVHHQQRCCCGLAFISNHPARKKCFICSPYRGRRKK